MSTSGADHDAIAEALDLEIREEFEALEDIDDLWWSYFDSLLDKAITAGVTVVGEFEFPVFMGLFRCQFSPSSSRVYSRVYYLGLGV